LRARIRAGKAAQTYKECGPGGVILRELAHRCVDEKNAAQLETLIAAHRAADPDDAGLLEWNAELTYLQGDYEGTLKLLADGRDAFFARPGPRTVADSLRVRCLVKLKRLADAVREAEEIVNRRHGNRVLL